MQADAVHGSQPIHRFVVAQPDRDSFVVTFLDTEIDRHERGRTMVLRPVELDAAGYPTSCKADQGGFYYVLTVDKVVSGRLIENGVDAAADLWKDHYFEKLVLHIDCLPF